MVVADDTVVATAADTHLLVTGATGAIGTALVPRLLEDPRARVTVLLRATSEGHLSERLGELFAWWQLDAQRQARVDAVRGDVSEARLGMADGDYDAIARRATHLIHAAGNVRLDRTLDEARRDALDPARNIVALARDCQRHGRFRKLDYVSTIGVAGRTAGVFPEDPLPADGDIDYRNTYEQAKAEAERWLWQEIRSGLPATIHRPSMVVGDSRTGRIRHFQVFYHLIAWLSGQRSWGIVPRADGFTLDIVPVDYVAEAIRVASSRQETVGRIFHLCSGQAGALPIDQLTRSLRERLTGFGERLPPLRRLRPFTIRALIAACRPFASAKTRRALDTLPFFLAYFRERQQFSTTGTAAYFAAQGLALPQPLGYLPALMEFHRARKPR